VGVQREVLPQLAHQTLADPTIAGNPRVVASADEILQEVLEPAW
jgi:alcohol dehydrogenase class IV